MTLTPAEQELLRANSRANRAVLPPFAMTGIGQPQLALAPAAFGGLTLPQGSQLNVVAAFTKVDVWDTARPDVITDGLTYEATLPRPADNEIVVAGNGLYLNLLRIGGVGPTGAEFTIHLFKNDIDTGIGAVVDLSNQSDDFTVDISTPLDYAEGDTASVYMRSDIDGVVTFDISELFIFNIR